MTRSITALLASRDAARFSGRTAELRLIDRALTDPAGPAVVFLHGAGGVGKSTLVREAIRRAERAGYVVERLDGRDADALGGPARGLEVATSRVAAAGRALLVIDTFERIAALEHHLREELLGTLPAQARVLIAGRNAPSAGWSQDAWDAVTAELQLAPITDGDAAQLLQARGVQDPDAVEVITRWAAGLPLALAVAADAHLAGAGLPGRGGAAVGAAHEAPQLAATLLRRLAGDELEGADRDVLAVSSIASAVDARLLASVLPAIDGDHAEAWLRGLSFTERRGTRVALHDRVREALRGELMLQDPGRERLLRQRVADHLHARAVLGEPWLVVELAALIEDPSLRWGFSLSTDRFHVDGLRAGDASACRETVLARRPWWSGVQRFLDHAPHCVATVRDATGRVAGLCVAVTPALAPTWAKDDVVLGPWLAHASTRFGPDEVLLWRDAFDLVADEFLPGQSPVAALLNTAASTLCSPERVRCFYGSVDPDDAAAVRLSGALGAERVVELDVRDGERRVECHVLDHGADGLVGTARRLVYRDLGLPPPTVAAAGPVGLSAVRDALRSFHDPVALASSPLARGATVAERARGVRTLLRDAVHGTFGTSDDEQLQRAVLERGYLDDDGGHTRAALELHLSRTTYFRRLAGAATRVAEYVVAERASR